MPPPDSQPPSRRRHRRIAVATLVIACLAGVVLAGRDGDALSAKAALAQASARAADAGSFRVSITIASDFYSATGSGAVDTVNSRGTLRLTLEPPAGMPPRQGEESSTTEMVYDDRNSYINVPELLQAFPEAKPWLRSEIGDAAGAGAAELLSAFSGLSFSPLHQPERLLEFLRATHGEVETVGEETIGGVRTTHFRALVSLESLIEQTEGGQREVLAWELENLRERGMPSSWPLDIWIDRAGLARRFRTRPRVAEATGVFTIDYHDFGAPVEVVLPPPSQVMTDEQFAALLAKRPPPPTCDDESEDAVAVLGETSAAAQPASSEESDTQPCAAMWIGPVPGADASE